MKICRFILLLFLFSLSLNAQHDQASTAMRQNILQWPETKKALVTSEQPVAAHEQGEEHHDFKPDETGFHHISDLNVYSIGPGISHCRVFYMLRLKVGLYFLLVVFILITTTTVPPHCSGWLCAEYGPCYASKRCCVPQEEIAIDRFEIGESELDEKRQKSIMLLPMA